MQQLFRRVPELFTYLNRMFVDSLQIVFGSRIVSIVPESSVVVENQSLPSLRRCLIQPSTVA